MKAIWKARLVATAFAAAFGASAQAQQEIKIGVIYPLTGSLAAAGAEMRSALELAADIINNGAKGVGDLPFAAGGGLPNLKGAKIKLVFADHQGNPQIGSTEAERLISQEKVVALVGAYNSNVTATASQVAERNKVPFLNPESSSQSLTLRGFKWFFRTTPHDEFFAHNAFEFLKEVEGKKNIKIASVATFSENTLFGNEASKLQSKMAGMQGYNIVKQVSYPAKTTQLTSEVQTLKAANPTVLVQNSYSEAILSMKTYKELGYLPDMILANDAGFADTEFVKTLGKDAEYVISREVWALDLAQKKPIIKQVNDLFNARYKINFTGNSARSFTGLMVMADAINRAGSTDPEAIRKALTETNIPAAKLIMPWKGVKFDESGQNTLGAGILVQILDGKYNTIWPADLATREVVWPMPKWDQRR
ncbi:ABC transporter substrate-binding protein [Ideonella sp. BN130291]|uniref:ABC transporter substrate-binding protein n=1 Tax=Ideonella sp. BN130291 TaxID=3112940 RepID=UPI002E2609B9|nr:ABC transporter substrate-binding protein [Ideonella sp. BN130291]